MRKVIFFIALVLSLSTLPAHAHQPVILLNTDTTAARGPVLDDGTVSFAIRASFTKAGQKKGFRANFVAGDNLEVQYLIVDKRPENRLKNNQLPTLLITSPTGKRTTLTVNEREKFYEPYGKTNYLYLSRLSAIAEPGIYSFLITARAKAAITVAVGDREVPGTVSRGAVAATASPVTTSTPAVTPASTPKPVVTPTPTPAPTVTQSGYTMADVRANSTPAKCWTVIDKKVYDLTSWISSHPGGASPIRFLCGKDGTNSFKAQHANQSNPTARLASYLLGPLSP
jgi:hypothetical protein